MRLSGIEDVGCLSRCHVLICAVEADWFSGCRLNEQMTRFGMCSLSLLGAGRAWLSNSTGESSCPLFLGCLCSFLSNWLQGRSSFSMHGIAVCLCMIGWLPLRGCAVSAWILRSARSSC